MRLLFAEDDRDISKAVKTLLERSGYSVDVVFNGQDAIDYIESGEYDGVILDWMMPKRSGIEVLTQMRAKGFSEPVLILTARDSVDDRVKGLDTGAERVSALCSGVRRITSTTLSNSPISSSTNPLCPSPATEKAFGSTTRLFS